MSNLRSLSLWVGLSLAIFSGCNKAENAAKQKISDSGILNSAGGGGSSSGGGGSGSGGSSGSGSSPVASGSPTAVDTSPSHSKRAKFRHQFNSRVRSVVIHKNGKIVVGGDFTELNGTRKVNYIVRFNPDGSVDEEFMKTIGLGFDGPIKVLVLRPEDDALLVGGEFRTFGTQEAPKLALIKPDLTLDTEFMEEIPSGFDEAVLSLRFQPDGTLLVAGSFNTVDGEKMTDLASELISASDTSEGSTGTGSGSAGSGSTSTTGSTSGSGAGTTESGSSNTDSAPLSSALAKMVRIAPEGILVDFIDSDDDEESSDESLTSNPDPKSHSEAELANNTHKDKKAKKIKKDKQKRKKRKLKDRSQRKKRKNHKQRENHGKNDSKPNDKKGK